MCINKGHSTDMCIYVLEEMIEYFKSHNTSVFVDASKAYDKIDYWQLFSKILNIHVSVFIVNILVYWYSRQEMFIRWGNIYSTTFLVTNTHVESAEKDIVICFFKVYMNNLSLSLNSSGIGGLLGDHIINHLCYADSLCLISLRSSGMRHILDICDADAISHLLL